MPSAEPVEVMAMKGMTAIITEPALNLTARRRSGAAGR